MHPFLAPQLDEREQLYIHHLRTELNGCKVKTYLPKQPQVEREIKRLLKVLNKNTLLFPIIRSVIAGEYVNTDGTRCILTVVNTHDCLLLDQSSLAYTHCHLTTVGELTSQRFAIAEGTIHHYDLVRYLTGRTPRFFGSRPKVLLEGFEEVAMIAFKRTQIVIARVNNLLTSFFGC